MLKHLSRMRAVRRLLGVMLLTVSACSLAYVYARFASRQEEAPVPKENRIGYVDPGTCATCHQREAASYARNGMSHSFSSTVRDEDFVSAPGRAPFEHAPSGNRYSLRKESSRWFMTRVASTGEVDERRVDLVVGSGNHAKTFLSRNDSGKLIELPVSWYAENGGSWAMSPGYDNAHPQDFQRAIGYECMYCHNGFPDLEQQGQELTEAGIWKGRLAEGIDCQRCHGPGAAHVKAASSANVGLDTVRRSIVNPGTLDRGRQLSVCLQCHLETTSLRLPNSLQRYGRAAFSFRPGEMLEENALYFDHAPDSRFDDRFEVAHQGYRLEKSQCFRKSEMTCLTCHDPHNTYRGAEATAHYVRACTGCHASPHPALLQRTSQTCLDCHMPKRRTEDAVHVVMTDHFIQRKPRVMHVVADIPETIPDYRGDVVFFHAIPNGVKADSPEAVLYTALAQVAQDSNSKAGVLQAKVALEKTPSRHPEPYYILGAAYARLGDRAQAVSFLKAALERDKNFKPALRELATVYAGAGDLESAITIGRESVRGVPDESALRSLADIYLRAHRAQKAEEALTAALNVDAGNAATHNLNGIALLQRKDLSGAEAEFQKALRADPDNAEASNNLASLMADRGELTGAKELMRSRMARDPKNTVMQKTFAALLLRSGDPAGAAQSIRLALKSDPTSYDLHLSLGDILIAESRDGEAADEYRAASRLNPRSVEAHVGTASALANLHRVAEAQKEFEAALALDPKNPEAVVSMARLLLDQHKMQEASRYIALMSSSPDPALRQQALELSAHSMR